MKKMKKVIRKWNMGLEVRRSEKGFVGVAK